MDAGSCGPTAGCLRDGAPGEGAGDASSVDAWTPDDGALAAEQDDGGIYPVDECIGTTDILVLVGDPGDPVHPGKQIFTENMQTGLWETGALPGRLDVDIGPPGQVWRVQFASANGAFPIPPGTYYGAGDAYALDAGEMGIYVGQIGPGACPSTTGAFYIQDIELNSSNFASLTASFEQHCDGVAAALRGCIHYVGN